MARPVETPRMETAREHIANLLQVIELATLPYSLSESPEGTAFAETFYAIRDRARAALDALDAGAAR